MAQRRMLHKNISYSKQVNNLSNDFVKLLFTWTIPHLDDFGRIDGDPCVLKAIVMPMSKRPDSDFEEAITELINKKLAWRYHIDEQMVIEFPTFEKYQTGLEKRTKSKYPDNPRNSKTFQEIQEDSLPTEPNGTEKNLTKAKSTEPIGSFKGNGISITTKEFVPRSEGELAAYTAWQKLEPYNTAALQTTYLEAYRRGLPSNLFFIFTSEIKQDSNIKNPGAVFNKKVKDYLSNKKA
jgi:hypothetical protein